MSYEKISAVLHIGNNLLIVGFNKLYQWQFRAVTKEGKIVAEIGNFSRAEEAEKVGKEWINNNLDPYIISEKT